MRVLREPPTGGVVHTAILVGLSAVLVVNLAAAQPGHGRGSFSVECAYSHTLNDDPIVYPGIPGASHSHDFFGNVSTTASSTQDTLVGAQTSCGDLSDRAGYW